MIAPYLLGGALILGVVALCFLMNGQEAYRKGFESGYAASEEDAAKWLRKEAHKPAIRP